MPAEMTEHQLEVAKLTEETLKLARLTVAAHAVDAEDCARLLDILGLRQQEAAVVVEVAATAEVPTAPAATARKAIRVCDYGHRIPAADKVCDVCREYLPIGELRVVVERIQGGSDLRSIRAIAEKAGLNATSMSSALAPSKAQKNIRRFTYLAVLRVAEELGV